MISRKRPPLVSRPTSNASELVDWREYGKDLAACTNEKECERLMVKMMEARISDPEEVICVCKLMLTKLGRFPSIILLENFRGCLKNFLERLKISTLNTYFLGLVRIMIKHSSGNLIDWSGSAVDLPYLLLLELIAWDSISEGKRNKVRVRDKLEQLKHDENKIHFALSLDAESFLGLELTALSCPRERRVGLVGLLNVGVWAAMLNGSVEMAQNILSSVSCCFPNLAVVQEQVSLINFSLGRKALVPRQHRKTALMNALEQIETNLPLTECIPNETRYEVALLSLHVAKHTSDLVKRIVAASYCLHCLKWTQLVDLEETSGKEGILTLLVCDEKSNFEKILSSLIHPIPPLQRKFIVLEAVRIAGESYEAIGFVPGASWLYHKGLDFLRKNQESCYGDMFRRRLKQMHQISETAIADDVIDYSQFDEVSVNHEDRRPQMINQSCVSEKLGSLRRVVVEQYALQHSKLSHVDRLEKLRNSPVGLQEELSPRGVALHFSLEQENEEDGEFSLILCVKRDSESVATFSLVKQVIKTAISLSEELEEFLARNKVSIASRHKDVEKDSRAFWEDRKLFDQELLNLIATMESDIFPGHVVEFLNSFLLDDQNSQPLLVVMFLPDILLGLPVESFPVFRQYNCVRGVSFPGTVSPQILNEKNSKLCYVVNPNGDCDSSTQQSLKTVLDRKGWQGHSGYPTLSDSDFTRMLSESDVFVFSGHGGGEKHWSGTSVQRLWLKKSTIRAAILMGCASAKPYGDMRNAFCTPFHYLIGGAWVVVGTLWDVLGRELDRISLDIVENYSSVETLPQVVEMAKQKAKLKNLSTASIVVYVDVAYFP